MMSWGAPSIGYFRRLRDELGGLVHPAAYRAYYRLARKECKGSIIELGTGRGASTIALARGLKDGGGPGRVHAVDSFFPRTDRLHPAGREGRGEAAVAINVDAFRANLVRHGVTDYVALHVGLTTQVADFRDQGPFGMLVMDVDGRIDRDFARYYDWLIPGALVILDDCRNTIDRRGRQRLKRFRRKPRRATQRRIAKAQLDERGKLLGKHLLTWRLMRLMERKGLIRQEMDIAGTVFCRKITDGSYDELMEEGEVRAVFDGVFDDFVQLLDNGGNRLPGEAASVTLWRRLKSFASRWLPHLFKARGYDAG